jgi:hypothetical protein
MSRRKLVHARDALVGDRAKPVLSASDIREDVYRNTSLKSVSIYALETLGDVAMPICERYH